MTGGSAGRYWAQFLRSLPPGSPRPGSCYEAFRPGYGATPGEASETATEIAGLMRAGTKTSTGSLEWVYEAEGRRPPRAGDLSIVLDGHDRPVCIIETTEVTVLPYDEMGDERFAYEGGEGDRTLAGWRQMYWRYIVSECARLHREPTPKAPLVCERFRAVYRAPLEVEG
jgi:uncharacterized protein YhfF